MNFKISDKEGKNFSKLSGDSNSIHLDDVVGYNSIFREKICHGCLIILKIFKIIKIKEIIKNLNKFSIKIKFFKHFSYNKSISLKIQKNRVINLKLFQKGDLRAELEIKKINTLLNYQLNNKKYFLNTNKKAIKYFNRENKMGNLSMTLSNLTKYVGTVYPGVNSIIREININFNNKFKFNKNKTEISSQKINNIIPIIKNKITYQNYIIEFQTLKRPVFKPKKIKLNNSVRKLSKKIKKNILIIGGSSGIGYELLNIFKNNKNIKIIATFNKNKILLKQKNIKKVKVDLMKSINPIKKIIQKNHPIIIYYFATPKIDINLCDKKNYIIYKSFYVDLPLKILTYSKYFNINFFYPSTIFISKNKSSYVRAKRLGEKILSKQGNKKHLINILKIDEIYTRQNLSLFNRNLPNFSELLNTNRKYQRKIFFENKNS